MNRLFNFIFVFSLVFLYTLNRSVYKIPGLEWAFSMMVMLIYIFYIVNYSRVYAYELYSALGAVFVLFNFLFVSPFVEFYNEHVSNLTVVTVVWSLAFFYASGYVRSENKQRIVLSLACVWVLISCLFLVLEYLNVVYYDDKFSAHLKNRNNYAVSMAVILYFLLKDLEASITKNGLIIAFVLFILYSKSITAIIMVMMYLLAIVQSNFSGAKKIMLFVVFIISILLCYFIFDKLATRVDDAVNSFISPETVEQSSSGRARIWIAKEGVELLSRHLFEGVGVHNSKEYIKPDFNTGKYNGVRGYDTHNNYLELGISGGIFTVIFFYFPLLVSLYVLYRFKEWLDFFGVLSLFVISFVTRLFEFFPLMFFYFYFLMIGFRKVSIKKGEGCG